MGGFEMTRALEGTWVSIIKLSNSSYIEEETLDKLGRKTI